MRISVLMLAAVTALSPSCARREAESAADPRSVITDMLHAIHKSTAVQFDFTVTPLPSERPTVRASGGNVMASRQGIVRIDGWRDPLPGEQATREEFVLTSDGATVAMRSDSKRTLFFSPMHRAGGLVLNARVGRVIAPFSNAALFADRPFRAAGVARLDGVICDVLSTRSSNGKDDVRLAVARSDHLPRQFVTESADLRLTNLKVLDRVDSRSVIIDTPPNYAHRELTLGGPAAGEPAPLWTLQTSNGPISLSSLRGKVVILDFWATWCGPCRASLPEVKRLYDTYHARGLEVVGATWHEQGDPDAFAKELGLRYPHATGDAIGPAYGIENYGIPAMYVIDRNGIVADFFIGWGGDATSRKLESDITTLLDGRRLAATKRLPRRLEWRHETKSLDSRPVYSADVHALDRGETLDSRRPQGRMRVSSEQEPLR
jgi:thiol-disulfide isomerase/thioredoxin